MIESGEEAIIYLLERGADDREDAIALAEDEDLPEIADLIRDWQDKTMRRLELIFIETFNRLTKDEVAWRSFVRNSIENV